jgi:hypothetical protein
MRVLSLVGFGVVLGGCASLADLSGGQCADQDCILDPSPAEPAADAGAVPPPSSDGAVDAAVTIAPCGGPDEPRCMNGRACIKGEECWSGTCVGVSPTASGHCRGCPASSGMIEVIVPGSSPVRSFCIDRLETTKAEFIAFKAAESDASLPDAPFNCTPSTTQLPTQPNRPAEGVSFCDAFRYCAWKGKRLCGSTTDGKMLPLAKAADPTASEWMATCSRFGAYDQQPVGCQLNKSTSFDVGSAPTCAVSYFAVQMIGGGVTTSYQTALDLSGNVDEWEGACDMASGKCATRGGSYRSGPDAECGKADVSTVDGVLPVDVRKGIRCCGG